MTLTAVVFGILSLLVAASGVVSGLIIASASRKSSVNAQEKNAIWEKIDENRADIQKIKDTHYDKNDVMELLIKPILEKIEDLKKMVEALKN